MIITTIIAIIHMINYHIDMNFGSVCTFGALAPPPPPAPTKELATLEMVRNVIMRPSNNVGKPRAEFSRR